MKRRKEAVRPQWKNASAPPTENDYRRYLQRRSNTGNFFQCFRDYLAIPGMAEAELLLLQNVINLAASRADDEGWVPCTEEFLNEQMHYKDRTKQYRLLNTLTKLGLVEVSRKAPGKGMAATRHLRVDLIAVEQAVDVGLGCCCKSATSDVADFQGRNSYTTYKSIYKENIQCRPPADAEAGTEDIPMSLWNNRPPPPDKGAPSAEAKQMATTHRKWVAARGWAIVSTSQHKWAVPFQTLITKVGLRKARRMLTWYHKHHPDLMRKRLANGLQFHQSADLILSFMASQRDRRRAEREKETLRLDPRLKPLVRDAVQWGWPKGAAKDVPLLAQKTLEFYADFRERLGGVEGPLRGLARYLLDATSPVGQVEGWLRGVLSRVQYPDWSGELRYYAPKPDHKAFLAWGRGLSEEYTSPAKWDKLVAEVYG